MESNISKGPTWISHHSIFMEICTLDGLLLLSLHSFVPLSLTSSFTTHISILTMPGPQADQWVINSFWYRPMLGFSFAPGIPPVVAGLIHARCSFHPWDTT